MAFKIPKPSQTFTLTFGDQAENHVGMQKIGSMAKTGFTLDDLQKAIPRFAKYRKSGVGAIDLYDLGKLYPSTSGVEVPEAYLLVVRKGLCALVNDEDTIDDFYQEQLVLEKDTKALMYGRVVDKKARHNLCFSERAQEPVYEEGKGRIVPYEEVPVMNGVRNNLSVLLGKKAQSLCVEGNYYYDVQKCFIGFHGDSERRRVVGVRAGAPFPLHFQWYCNGSVRGRRLEIMLGHGDLYVMTEKTVGTDWKKKNIPTLRHAAGFAKALKLDPEAPMVSGDDFLDEIKEVEEEEEEQEYELDEDGYEVVEFRI